jgi:hypothetical protein
MIIKPVLVVLKKIKKILGIFQIFVNARKDIFKKIIGPYAKVNKIIFNN